MFSEEYHIEDELAIGDKIEFSWEFSEDDIEQFASLVGDENPIHTNEEFAEDSVFGERIAHGVLGLGVISSALARLPGTIIYRSMDATFQKPIKPGDELEATALVSDNPKGNKFVVETTLTVNGDTAIEGEAKVISN